MRCARPPAARQLPVSRSSGRARGRSSLDVFNVRLLAGEEVRHVAIDARARGRALSVHRSSRCMRLVCFLALVLVVSEQLVDVEVVARARRGSRRGPRRRRRRVTRDDGRDCGSWRRRGCDGCRRRRGNRNGRGRHFRTRLGGLLGPGVLFAVCGTVDLRWLDPYETMGDGVLKPDAACGFSAHEHQSTRPVRWLVLEPFSGSRIQSTRFGTMAL